MRLRLPLLLIALTSLLACGQAGPVPAGPETTQASARASMENALDQMLEDCLEVAKAASSRTAAERVARERFNRLAAARGYKPQFQVQTQATPHKGLQIQLQAQLVKGSLSVQAQRQVVQQPFPAKR